MQAINHVATALILKRSFPSSPLWGLLLATEAVEYLWVGLNLVGVEQTIISGPMRSVADVHLIHMPFSHSIAASVVFAALTGMLFLWCTRDKALAIAIALSVAVFSHIVLDLVVHAPDIPLLPFGEGQKYGSGLYSNWPLIALIVEISWGIICWRVFRGGWLLLVLIVGLNILSLPIYSSTINLGEDILSGNSTAFALVVLGQILGSTLLVWVVARRKGTV